MSAKLILRNLRLLIKNRPMRFLLIVISQIFAAFCVLATLGISMNVLKPYESPESELQDINSRNVRIDTYIDETYMSEVEFRPVMDRFIEKFGELIESYDYIGAFMDGEKKYSYIASSLLQVSDPTTLCTVKKNGTVGEKYSIQGKEYTMIDSNVFDKSGMSCNYIFPYSQAPEGYAVSESLICLSRRPTVDEAMEIQEYLQKQLNIEKVYVPEGVSLQKQQMNSVTIAICAGIAIVVIFSISLIYLFEIEQRQRSLAIFRYCGCTKENALAMLLCEISTILLASFAVAFVLFRFAALPFIEKSIENYAEYYTPASYGLLLAGYAFVSLIVFAASIVDLLDKSAVEMERRL